MSVRINFAPSHRLSLPYIGWDDHVGIVRKCHSNLLNITLSSYQCLGVGALFGVLLSGKHCTYIHTSNFRVGHATHVSNASSAPVVVPKGWEGHRRNVTAAVAKKSLEFLSVGPKQSCRDDGSLIELSVTDMQ